MAYIAKQLIIVAAMKHPIKNFAKGPIVTTDSIISKFATAQDLPNATEIFFQIFFTKMTIPMSIARWLKLDKQVVCQTKRPTYDNKSSIKQS